MNFIKLTVAAATFTVALVASAFAMPVGNLGAVNAGGSQAEQVRLVCNQWGRCWHVGGYYYGGYRGGWRGRGRWHR